MKSIILVLKGIIIGVANVIPGVSTATFMVLLRVYDEIVDAVRKAGCRYVSVDLEGFRSGNVNG